MGGCGTVKGCAVTNVRVIKKLLFAFSRLSKSCTGALDG